MAGGRIGRNLEQVIDFICYFIRDDKRLNTLIGTEESTRDQVKNAIELALDDFNNTTIPYTSYQLSNISSFPSLKLLTYGTAIELLTSNGILESRNRLNYSDGGISVNVSDSAAEYQSWINMFIQTYERKKLAMKNAANVENGFLGVESPYNSYNSFLL